MKIHHSETLQELLSDIRQMRDLIIYFENKILRKQVAIEEILSKSADENEPSEEPATEPPKVESTVPVRVNPTVIQMIKEVLPQFNKGIFWYTDVLKLCCEKYPESTARIKRGIYTAFRELLNRGTIKRCPEGFTEV